MVTRRRTQVAPVQAMRCDRRSPGCRLPPPRRQRRGAGVSATLYRWFYPGEAHEVGWTFTGIVSTWPDTGKVRAELWERSE